MFVLSLSASFNSVVYVNIVLLSSISLIVKTLKRPLGFYFEYVNMVYKFEL